MLKIYPVEADEDIEQIRILWRQYAEYLNTALGEYSRRPEFKQYFQDYEYEITHLLPGSYARPRGCLLLAEYEGKTAGCVGLKDLGGGICEMKRLFVKPEYRGRGIGKMLAKAVIEQGQNTGYMSMRLNTNQMLAGAVELYSSFAFNQIAPYEHFSIDGMVFMELKLV